MDRLRSSPTWLILAVASGACASFNGVFAKLTTTTLTTTWAHAISKGFGLSPGNHFVEYIIRGLFFALNLLFNAIMWGLFTRALTLASSTVRVSIINTSANFMLTAVLGALIFSESLPGVWWIGAAMLVAGSVIIGSREEGKKTGDAGTGGAEPLLAGQEGFRDEEADKSDEEGEDQSDLELETVKDDGEEVDGVLLR
ncbi:hypothetical protein BU16DRAFT_507341 [Lophium mytilinum]|uniref:EamA domain-containing protein n=1 Tax=Lophium mytilinum TaxID=390894 RepID=A0A6A6QW94_9PEZI|nr:hypothetical protein BU16DRAFT_507341 [Lophium mytilinum]